MMDMNDAAAYNADFEVEATVLVESLAHSPKVVYRSSQRVLRGCPGRAFLKAGRELLPLFKAENDVASPVERTMLNHMKTLQSMALLLFVFIGTRFQSGAQERAAVPTCFLTESSRFPLEARGIPGFRF
jgi:hypothetical protein